MIELKKLEVPDILPTLNEVIESSKKVYQTSGSKRIPGGKYWKEKRKLTGDISTLAKAASLTLNRLPVDFLFVWYRRDRRTDKDNITVGQKYVLDGLVEAGVLENDGWSQIGDLFHLFKLDKENPRLVVYMGIQREVLERLVYH